MTRHIRIRRRHRRRRDRKGGHAWVEKQLFVFKKFQELYPDHNQILKNIEFPQKSRNSNPTKGNLENQKLFEKSKKF